MRKSDEIKKDGTRKEDLIIEVLLDVRTLMEKLVKDKKTRKKEK